IKKIANALYDTREQDREDKNNAMAMQFFGELMGSAIQNPEALRTIVELSQQNQIEDMGNQSKPVTEPQNKPNTGGFGNQGQQTAQVQKKPSSRSKRQTST
ncbi:MAG: hypothetical protein F6K32_28115, partial [Desertifilum sp. SIO1I2]|nr:hypothetical protein [Desertifilum sp. SIO1I2]